MGGGRLIIVSQHVPMKYQLVLQMFGDSLRDYDALIALEDRLAKALRPSHLVDGHDFGSGEMNIFVHSNDPKAAFSILRSVIPAGMLGRSMKAGYREIAGEDYAVIWPPGSIERFEVK